MHVSSTFTRRSSVKSTTRSRGSRRSAVLVQAEKAQDIPLNVLEAREWIAAWRFKQANITSLGDSISKAAAILEDTKRVRQARLAAEDLAKSVRVPVNFSVKQKVQYGQSIKLVGGAPEFGSWSPDQASPMTWSEGDVWNVTLKLPVGKHEFKVVGAWESGDVEWESGDNRMVEVPLGAQEAISVSFTGKLSGAAKA